MGNSTKKIIRKTKNKMESIADPRYARLKDTSWGGKECRRFGVGGAEPRRGCSPIHRWMHGISKTTKRNISISRL